VSDAPSGATPNRKKAFSTLPPASQAAFVAGDTRGGKPTGGDGFLRRNHACEDAEESQAPGDIAHRRPSIKRKPGP
jgi:hypothetical protein